MRVAVTGANGFIGHRIVRDLAEHTKDSVVAISRSGASSFKQPNVEARSADFFSLYSAETALAGCEVGIYLLHSMTPSHRLTQGSFEDFDFILADNFARAARLVGMRQIIYVGGMVDENLPSLSRHLASRLEVESVLGSYGVPVTALRCSLVIGAEGSSFIMLQKLAKRLPVMLLPSWCGQVCQPVAVDDLVLVLRRCLDNPATFARSFDVGSPLQLTYRDLIEMTARIVRARPILVDVPAVPITLSKLWIQLITGAPKSLVYPLVDSLAHPMTIRPGHEPGAQLIECYTPLESAIRSALADEPAAAKKRSVKTKKDLRKENLVQSVQRITLPKGMDAFLVAHYYFRWLSRFFTHILVVRNNGRNSTFYLSGFDKPLLELSFAPTRSSRDRQLFYISGGLLAQSNPKARLEFRESPDRAFVFAAIHDYRPSLPWWVYRATQALLHRYVMWRFGRFLQRASRKQAFLQQAPASRPSEPPRANETSP